MERDDITPIEVMGLREDLAGHLVAIREDATRGEVGEMPDWLVLRLFGTRSESEERLPLGIAEARKAYDLVQLVLFVETHPMDVDAIVRVVGSRDVTGIEQETAAGALSACLNNGVVREVASGNGDLAYALSYPVD